MSTRLPGKYAQRVFVNVPYDDDYLPLLYAIVYTILFCGHAPVYALQWVGGRNRVDKIKAQILDCRLSIHDLSRTEVRAGELPRFNMPYELGLADGANAADPTRNDRSLLVLTFESLEHYRLISDIAGYQPEVHGGQTLKVIRAVTRFLETESGNVYPKPREIYDSLARFGDSVRVLPRDERADLLGLDNLVAMERAMAGPIARHHRRMRPTAPS